MRAMLIDEIGGKPQFSRQRARRRGRPDAFAERAIGTHHKVVVEIGA